MAEFKLGRIRFVWQGEWTTGTTYAVDDVVNVGGKTYICVINHTASEAFDTDFNIPGAPKWNLMSDGTQWRGDWVAETLYNLGDQVQYGGTVYVCKEIHTSATNTGPTYDGLEVDYDKWDVFAQSIYWAGTWTTSHKYRVRDMVSYGGVTYLCTTAHISAATNSLGLEDDLGNWEVFNQGISYIGTWDSGERYKLNDVVKYGADLWICTTNHTSSGSFDAAKFDIFVNGLQFESSWDSGTTYQVGDVVTYGGYVYVAQQNHTNQVPSTATAYWTVYATGFNYRSEWQTSTDYRVGDVVRLGGYTYLATADSNSHTPPNALYWTQLNSGLRWTGASTTYLAQAGTTLTGVGTGAKFDVVRAGTRYTATIAAGFVGSGYSNGNTIKILGTQLGGLSPVNDVVLTVATSTGGAIDTVTADGISVTWTTGTAYVLGDVVMWGASSFVCVSAHVAGSGNRPDNDLTATYWNLLSSGTEPAVLTTTGDMFYYGENGATRLPIGSDGQVLRVKDGYPEWEYYGLVNNVVYVAPTGEDSPASTGCGLTVDKPWKSIRYACQQVENGYMNMAAAELLAKNKQFLMKEVSNFVSYTYKFAIQSSSNSTNRFTATSTANMSANMPISFNGTTGGVTAGTTYYVKTVVNATDFTISNTLVNGVAGDLRTLTLGSTPMTGTLVYDYTMCERDVGLIVNALAFDLSHGGNSESVTAAKAYFTTAGNAYITGNFGQQAIQTVNAYNFLDTLVGDVLANTAPGSSYQYLNNASTLVAQIIDTTLTAEDGTTAMASDLIGIITSAITAGTVSDVPTATLPNTTIFIKTGTYNEVLPIVVPRNTAVVGDELRGTVVQPAGAIALLANDKPKTISAINRIKSLVPSIVSNTPVVTSAGNTADQTFLALGTTTDASVSINANAAVMTDVIANGNIPTFVLPTPTGGSNNASDAGFFNGARLVYANKAFLQAEVSAWIDAQILAGTSPFNGFTYAGASRTKCERDVGYIVDALRFDLTYGGNLATVVAARSYYSNGILVEVGEKAQALAVENRIKDIIDNIVTGNTAGWTKTPANALTQVTSGTAGSAGAATFAQARIQEIYDTINTGTEPTTVAPDITWPNAVLTAANTTLLNSKLNIQTLVIDWIKTNYPAFVFNATLCSRDIGYIVDALRYDMMFGSNFLSAKAAMSYLRGLTSTAVVTGSQLQPTLGTIALVNALATEYTTGVTGTVGSTVALNRISNSADIIYDLVNNGIAENIGYTITDPTGYNTSFLSGYGDGRTQVTQNRAFILAEISAYLNVNYNSVWTALGVGGQANCTRDVGYILDALQYDLTYGGNVQSLIAGSAYYSYSQLDIASTELTAIIAAYGRLKTIIGQIVVKTSVTPTAGNAVSQVTTGTAGSAGAQTFAQARIQDVVDWVTNGTAPASVAPSTSWVPAELVAANAALQAKRAEIQSDVTVWVKKFYQEMNFDTVTCARDAGLIVDALCYDMMFGSTFNATVVGYSYHRALSSVNTVLTEQLSAELGSINFIKYKAKAIAGTGAVAQVTNALTDVTTAIVGGAVPRTLWPDFTGIDAENALAAKLIWRNKKFIQAEVLQYITNNYPSVVYDKATCMRDVGYIVDAVRYDLTYGGNFATRQAGLAYYSALTSTLEIASTEKTATIAAYGQMKSAMQAISSGGAYSALQTMVARETGSYGDATSSTTVGSLVDGITTTINSLGSAPAETLPSYSWVSSALSSQYTALIAAKTTIKASVISYINTNYPLLTYDDTTCSRDVGYVIDAVGFDMMFGSNFRSIKAGMSYYRAQASLVVGAQKEATLAAFNYLKLQIAAIVANDATSLARANQNMQIIIDILDKGIGETPEVHGTMTYNNNAGTIRGAEFIRANKEFLAEEATAWISATFTGTVTATTASTGLLTTSSAHNLSVGDPVTFTGTLIGGTGLTAGATYIVATVPAYNTFTLVGVTLTDDTGSMTVTYSYDPTSCRRDMIAYLDAVIYDLNYVGNYKSLRAAQLYNNAVGGSLTENMYLVRNGTGVRNMTLNGLTGTLTNPNAYGTKRPTAGAYVSLDPGFGPNDRNVWITTRSCYSQNVTMFGTGCVGGKIDGALHAGGNRSTVANDFTTILSDGIGVWVTGSGALTELVSVFNYYGYAGYLAELGGRIRATNGNSSYGTYGVIAEGTDTYEVPLFGTVDNRYNPAQIDATITDGTDQVLRFEYGNAGSGYTNTVHTISGSGYNATAVGDEFRDAAVFETRIIDMNDSQGVGGTNYATQANAAQGGATGYITIAATDTALTDAYNGMRIQLTAGTGVGQYANILSYLNGSKVAQVYKDSFTALTVTATAVTNNLLTVASTASLAPGMPIYLTSSANGLTANTLYYVRTTGFTSTQFSVSLTGAAGTAVTITGTGTVSITLLAAGWDHVIPGATVVNALDLTTAYIVEPRISYSAPGYTATARTMSATATWKSATYGAGNFVAIANGSTNSSYSTDGKTWATAGALSANTAWTSVVYGGGEGATATAIVGGLGGSGAVLVANLGVANTTGAALADQIASVTIVDGGRNYTTPPAIIFTPTSGGSGAIATCTVLDGKIASVTVTIPGSGYNAAPTVEAATDRVTGIVVNTWGRNYPATATVTVSGGGSSNQATAKIVLTNGGVSAVHLIDANTIEEGTGQAGYLGWSGTGYTSTPTVTILDGTAKFVAVSSTANNSTYQTVAGLGTSWTAGGSTGKTDLQSLTYGNGLYVAVGGTSTTPSCVSSIDGTTWISRSITGSVAYTKVAYGNGVFVAIASGSTTTSTSSNAVAWSAGGTMPTNAAWSGLAYGNGRFVAIAGSSTSAAYSIDKGATWTASTLPASIAWSQIKYGQGLFVAIATGTSSCATSPDGINWTLRAMPSSSNWTALAFGNPSNNPIWIAASNTSGTVGASINTGATALGRVKVASGVVTAVRMIEPGSGYPKGTVSATTVTTNLITVDNTINLMDSQPIEFFGTSAGGLTVGTTYYVIGSTITSTQFKVSATAGSSTAVTLSSATVSGMTYRAGPIVTVTDPNKVKVARLRVRLGDGALGNPSFSNRGTNNATAQSSTAGDGHADLYQPSAYINVRDMYSIPVPGANIEFASLPGQYFKLVIVTNELGVTGAKTAQFQINPALTVAQAPAHGDLITTRLYYSQVRLTGHDFLYIGTGNQTQTNYPNVDPTTAIQAHQELASGGGRVFFTSTDQDGNFNVGNLFGVQQATGTATLNASAFNLAGLNSLQLGAVELGVGSAIITQFSTDPYFTANSDNIVPTQRAIKAYITAQIGGGSSSLNVNTLTSGVVYIANNTISTTTGVQINVTSKMNFTGGIDGAPVALGFFMQR